MRVRRIPEGNYKQTDKALCLTNLSPFKHGKRYRYYKFGIRYLLYHPNYSKKIIASHRIHKVVFENGFKRFRYTITEDEFKQYFIKF